MSGSDLLLQELHIWDKARKHQLAAEQESLKKTKKHVTQYVPSLWQYRPFQEPILMFSVFVLFHVLWSNAGDGIKQHVKVGSPQIDSLLST